MKRALTLLLILALLAALPACGSRSKEEDDARVTIVTTCFPIYDWTRNVVGEVPNVKVVWLMDSGVDPHSFQPTVKDLAQVSDCDAFIFVGGESDQWAKDAAAEMKNAGGALSLLDLLVNSAVEEAPVPGAQSAHLDEPGALDEHIWMSPRIAAACTDIICSTISRFDVKYAKDYRANADAYIEQLNALDAEYAQVISDSRLHTIVVADRFPFRYLAEAYGITYFAAFSGCSAETEASFQTVLGLAQQVDALDLPVILTIDGGDDSISRAVQDAAKHETEIRMLNSLQTTTAKDAEAGATYLSVMSDNLGVLKEALKWHS